MNLRPKTSRARGSLIVIEGLDGAGTTTQTAALARELRRRGRSVVTTCEPSDGPVGNLLRQALTGRLRGLAGSSSASIDAHTLALLFAADRTDHVAQVVEPAVRSGKTVLCDRYLLSSLAYQGMELGLEWVESINARAPLPDLTLFVGIDPRTARNRLMARGAASGRHVEELFDALRTQQRVARAYQKAIAHRSKREAIVQVDGALPMEEVTARLLEQIDRQRLGGSVARRRRSGL